MGDKYEHFCVQVECETAEAAIKRLVRALSARGVEVLPQEIEDARRSAWALSFYRNFG